MKAIVFLAVIVLAANAQEVVGFNPGEYYTGFTERLGLNQDQLQDGKNCFDAINNIVMQFNDILETYKPAPQYPQYPEGSQSGEWPSGNTGEWPSGNTGEWPSGNTGEWPSGNTGEWPSGEMPSGEWSNGENEYSQGVNVEELISSLLNLYGQAKSSITGECKPFLKDLQDVLRPDWNNPSLVGLDESAPLSEILGANWNFYFPQIIKLLGTWVQQMNSNQWSQAGTTNAQIIRILLGTETLRVQAQTLTSGTPVAFDKTKFFTQFFTAFFNTLGGFKSADVTKNIKSLSTCYDGIVKILDQFPAFQTQTASLSFLDTFYATKGLFTTFASNLKTCRPAYQLVSTLATKINTKVLASNKGYYQVMLNLLLNFPQIETNLMNQAINVDIGKYDKAGNIAANTLKTIFANAATFPL
jgi:hypothetical protein